MGIKTRCLNQSDAKLLCPNQKDGRSSLGRHRMHLTSPQLALLMLASCVAAFAGCAGEDDFSKPDPAIAARLTKAKEKLQNNPEQGNSTKANKQTALPENQGDTKSLAKTEGDNNKGEQKDSTTSVAKDVPGTEEKIPSESEPKTEEPSGQKKTGEAATGGIAGLLGNGDQSASPPSGTDESKQKSDEPATPEKSALGADMMTADGRTKGEIDKQKASDESVADAGVSLLDKLTETAPRKPKPTGRRRSSDDDEDIRPIARLGRFAIAARTWLQLQNQLAKQFYVASTENGRRFAGSSGQRSLGVLSTQVEPESIQRVLAGIENNAVARKRPEPEAVTHPIRLSSGLISSIELIQNGDVILIGTKDGRLVARGCAQRQDWDLYAQDLMSFQDLYRTQSKLSEVAITTVRMLNSELLLTIDANLECRVWRMNDVVHAPTPPTELNETTVRSPKPQITTADPVFTIPTPKYRALNITLSAERSRGAIVTSDDQVTVFAVKTGEIIATLSAADLNDTQPVVALPHDSDNTILIGLADGRLCHRSLSKESPVSSTNDEGQTVDYDMVFTPDVGDRSGPITALELKWDQQLLYLGRLDGSVSHFDIVRKQMVSTFRLHRGPVLSASSTRVGLFTVGDDRQVKLSDQPVLVQKTAARARTFDLPKDNGLKSEIVIEDPDQPERDRLTRARNVNRNVKTPDDDEVSAVGIRPADPVQALYEHRLRVAQTPEDRQQARDTLSTLDLPQREQLAMPEETDRGAVSLTLVSQIATRFDFQARPIRRVIMAVSNDGTLIGAAQRHEGAIVRKKSPNESLNIWDAASGTTLRTWRTLPGIRQFEIFPDTGLVATTPFAARLDLYSGQFESNLTEDYSIWTTGIDQKRLIVAVKGTKGLSQAALKSINLESGEVKRGLEAFEGQVTAMALAPDDSSLFVNLRERAKIRLLEIDAVSLRVKRELTSKVVSGNWDLDKPINPSTVTGAAHIVPTPTGDQLVTYGHYENGWQFRIWNQKNGEWSIDDVTVIPITEPIVETKMTDTPFQFVQNQDRELAVITQTGVTTLGMRKGRAEQSLVLPDIDNRRPVTLLTPDGRLALAGDRDGKIYLWKLKLLDGKPRHFTAHGGPIVGMASSPNGRFLATIGEENRMRIWDLQSIDPDRYQSDNAESAGE